MRHTIKLFVFFLIIQNIGIHAKSTYIKCDTDKECEKYVKEHVLKYKEESEKAYLRRIEEFPHALGYTTKAGKLVINACKPHPDYDQTFVCNKPKNMQAHCACKYTPKPTKKNLSSYIQELPVTFPCNLEHHECSEAACFSGTQPKWQPQCSAQAEGEEGVCYCPEK